MIGIYKITSPSGRVYIGQSTDIERRFREYKSYRSISQTKLHRSFLKYGVSNHSFEVIIECKIKDLNRLERYFQDYYDVLVKGLNCILTKSGDKSGVLSNETKLRIGEKSKGRIYSEEYKSNMSKIMTGRAFTKEWRVKLSEAALKRGFDYDVIKKSADKRRNIKLSQEHKNKIIENSPRAKRVICNASHKIWTSINQCAIDNNMNSVTLNRMLNGKRKNKTTLMLLDHE